MANALLDPRLSRGEVDYQFRVRQLEGELSVQSKLTAELEQSNAQLQQQIFQADQTKIQLHKRCSHLYDLVRAQLKEKRGNNEEITLLRDQLHELRGQHQRLLAERLEPAPSLPHGPDSEWVDVLGGGLIPENVPRNASFQAFNFPEGQQRPPLSRMESSDLSPAEKEAIRTRMLTDRGPTRAFSVRDGGAPSPHGEADRERSGEASPERATGGPSRGIKVEASARVPEEVDSSLPSRRGNDEPQHNLASSPLPSEDCAKRRRGSKVGYAGVHPVKTEIESSDEDPSPSCEGQHTATPESEPGDQEKRGDQREGHGCKKPGMVYAGEGPRATPPPPVPSAARGERSPRSSASYPMQIASPHSAIPFNGLPSGSSRVDPDGLMHDSRKPSAHQQHLERGAAVASSLPTSESAAVSQHGSVEGPGVFAPSPAVIVAEPNSMEVVASSSLANAHISSELSDALPASSPSASNFRRNTASHLLRREACPDSTMQIDRVEACPTKEMAAVDSDGPSMSAETRRTTAKAPKVESCVPSKDGCAPLAPDPVLDRYLYVTFCSVCREPREERKAVALCQLCPRMFCGVCAGSLGQTVDPAPGASDVLLPGDSCVCLQRDSEFPKPPEDVRPEVHLLEQLIAHNLSLQFREPVDVLDNPGYLGVITRSEMMDLDTMKENMRRKRYETTRGQRQFRLDVKQIWLNCWKFAGCSREDDAPLPGIVSCALILERMVGKFCDAYMQGEQELFENPAGNRSRRERFAHAAQNSTTSGESEEEPEFEESDEETESEPEPEMVDILPLADALPGRKRKAAPPVDGMVICSDTDRPHEECAASLAKKVEPAEILCSLAGIGEKLLTGSGD